MNEHEMRDRELRADCERCFGLCCVAPAFAASADFAIDKPARSPCPHLQTDFRCGIHNQLRRRGFPGCSVYDCFGAGQKVAQLTFGGHDWRHSPHTAEKMFDVFAIMRRLHELLWYLTEALSFERARPLHDQLRLAVEDTERLSRRTPEALLALDLDAHHDRVSALLAGVSEVVRAAAGKPRRVDRRGADLIGKDLSGRDFRGASLRGTYLIGANLSGADLRLADVIGADFRGADLSGADLTDTLFLTQSQIESASGDRHTKLPAALTRPAHWLSETGHQQTCS